MKKYTIFYNDIKIGLLEINENNQYKYTPDRDGVEKVKDSISIFYEMMVESDWGKPIPFFENRLKDAERFSQEDEIANQTDPFRMVKI